MSSDLVVQDQIYADGKYMKNLAQQSIPGSVLLDYWHNGYTWSGSIEPPSTINEMKQKEKFNNNPKTQTLIWFLRFSFAFYAAYLSFNCNFVPTPEEPNRGFWMALFNALIAALFGPLYLLYYLYIHCLGDTYLASIGLPTTCPSQINNLINQLGSVTYPLELNELMKALK